MNRNSGLLKQLERLKDAYGQENALTKIQLLEDLRSAHLSNSREVFRLHEILCFLRAFPDNKDLFTVVEKMLLSFDRRKDLRAYRSDLENTGIAGTDICFPFYWFTALWLANRWPKNLSIIWKNFALEKELKTLIPLLVPFCEIMGSDEVDPSPRHWIDASKGPAETDASFLIKRFEKFPADSFTRETIYEKLDIPIRITPGKSTPNRTQGKYDTGPVVFQDRPLNQKRPTLLDEIKRAPLSVRLLPAKTATGIIHLARVAMVTRSRDLDIFEHAETRDVHLIDCGGGLQFACIGATPERRFLLEAVYAFLTLKNGVPIGYVLASAFHRSSEVAYNVFESFRAAESAFIYGRVIAMIHHLFESDTFTVDPYQLGKNNKEGIQSGAWWFYYKMGFRPHDPDILRIALQELRKMKNNPMHRSDIRTLKKLSAKNMFLYLHKERDDVLGRMSLSNIQSHITHTLARGWGADRERGIEQCSHEMARWLGVRAFSNFSKGERLAWNRWSPLIVSMPEIQHWNAEHKKALVQIIRAKGGESEIEFVKLLNQHPHLMKILYRLSKKPA